MTIYQAGFNCKMAPVFDIINLNMLVAIIIQLNLIALGALAFTAGKIFSAYKNYRYRSKPSEVSRDDLPAVSVCLPARNETNTMTECLESVLASDYPKLEIIVLDDNSSDNTSNLIKAFAHSGVRFVQGSELPEGWLGKNYALENLLTEASGRYVIFMDVDTRVERSTIRLAVERALTDEVDMISVIPQRFDTHRASAWLGTLRYFWEIILDSPRRPGSSAAFWLVRRRKLIDELGGFSPWRDQVQPEMHIARRFTAESSHSLVVSTPDLGVSYAKKWSSQVETSRRVLLPSFYNSIFGALVGAGLLLTVALPQVALVVAMVDGLWLIFAAEFILGMVSAIIFAAYLRLAWKDRWLLGVIASPLVAWQELWLLASSVVGYRMETITWKGRPVSRPSRKKLKRIS